MTIRQELVEYANNCISDKIPSCKKHKWACKRFLRDLKKADQGWLFYWNEDEAQKIVDWFALLKHRKGVLAGQYIHLTTAQKFSICQLYGWREVDTDRKRFTNSYKQVGRKNAKSQELAGVVLYEMSVGSTRNGEIYETYCAGTKRDQSRIIFDECQNMLAGSPLRLKFDITRNIIRHKKTGSFFKPLSKEDGKKGDGTNPAVLILDEYHQHDTTEFYDLGLGGGTKESLLMIITTAGVDLNVPCYTQEYELCSNILNPDVDLENDRYLVDIFEAEDGDDPALLSTWQKANPIRAFYPEGIEKIKQFYDLACAMPEKMTAFLTKVLNIWVQAKDSGYMDMAMWKRCEVDELPFDITGMPVYVGFDMSAKIDLTSVAFVIPFQSGENDEYNKPIVKYIVFSHSFIPNREKLMERTKKDKFPFDAYERIGYITVTNSEIVNQNAVMKYVFEFIQKYKLDIQALCFDPANASKMMLELSDEGYDVQEVYQSHKSLNEATAGFREQTYEGNVLYTVNPVLNFAMRNAVIKSNNGLIKIDKDATKRRIDPVDALLCAFKLALYHEFDTVALSDAWLDEDD